LPDLTGGLWSIDRVGAEHPRYREHETDEAKGATVGTTRASRMVIRSLLAVALLVSTASSVFDLYDAFWRFDEALHGYFLFALTLVLALYACGAVLTGASSSGPDMTTIRRSRPRPAPRRRSPAGP